MKKSSHSRYCFPSASRFFASSMTSSSVVDGAFGDARRSLLPKRSAWRVAQFDTLRLRLVKIAARVVEMKTQIRLHLPSACPYQAILRTV